VGGEFGDESGDGIVEVELLLFPELGDRDGGEGFCPTRARGSTCRASSPLRLARRRAVRASPNASSAITAPLVVHVKLRTNVKTLVDAGADEFEYFH